MVPRSLILALFLTVMATPPRACELALVLAVDVSGSVDEREYAIQMQGLAAALRDGIVVDALIEQQAMLTLIQWTGSSRQRQTIPWTPVSAINAPSMLIGYRAARLIRAESAYG